MDNIATLEKFCGDNQIWYENQVPLSEHCTFQIGGTATLFLRPSSEEQIQAAASCAAELKIPVLVLGKGSNMLFSDEGFAGAVLHLGTNFARMRLEDGDTISCDSGVPLMDLCNFACENELSGLEFAYGIPGSVGGAVYMNAGAYDGEMKDVLVSTRHISPQGGAGGFFGGEMQLSYRHSVYTDSDLIITGAVVRLRPGKEADIRAKMEDFMQRRRTKQPLEYPSAGSTFQRPQGAYASALIDSCGLKGVCKGGAMVSEKHAGFVINYDHATCRDVLALIDHVKEVVNQKTGFSLACEVKIIGD